MLISELDPNSLTITQITQLLFSSSDDGEVGNCIFVPGSSKCVQYRVPVAVELYLKGRAPKVLFTGGRVWSSTGNVKPEAVLMKEKALELGARVEDILVETQSLSTEANVLLSAPILERAIGLEAISRMILVTTAFHMRRLLLTMKTHLPKSIQYTCCPAQDLSTRSNNWWLSPNGTMRATEEARKLIGYVQQGLLIDDIL